MRNNNRKKQRKKKRLFMVAAILLAVVVLSGCLALSHLRHPLTILRPPDPDGEGSWETEIAKNFDKDVVNFLLMGFDRTAERDKIYSIYRPDTMVVISVNFRSAEMALLSIPRDSYVNIYNQNTYDKINSAYMYGHEYGVKGVPDPHQAGLTCTVKTVEELLGGIPIHYYFTVDMDGVVEIVDKLGGIYYDVEIPIKDTDGRLLVDKGYRKLSGNDYLQYCRYRGVGGDTGRTQRQLELLIATFKQLKQAGKLVKIPQVYKSLTETVDTNLSISQMASLALYGKEIDPDDIKSHVLAGSTQWAPRGEFDICYLVIDEPARVDLIKEVFGLEVAGRSQITLPGPRARPQPHLSGQEQVSGEIPDEQLPEQPPFMEEEGELWMPEDPWQWDDDPENNDSGSGFGDDPDDQEIGGSGSEDSDWDGTEPGDGDWDWENPDL